MLEQAAEEIGPVHYDNGGNLICGMTKDACVISIKL